MNNALLPIIQSIHLAFIFKIVILIILGLFFVFTFVLMLQVRALSNVIKIYAYQASRLITLFAVIYFFLAIALFISALVIL